MTDLEILLKMVETVTDGATDGVMYVVLYLGIITVLEYVAILIGISMAVKVIIYVTNAMQSADASERILKDMRDVTGVGTGGTLTQGERDGMLRWAKDAKAELVRISSELRRRHNEEV